jgi:5-methylcytosine-specific restriction endonuclease McrA
MTEYFSAYYAENRARYAAQRANRREEIALYNAEWRVRNPGYHNVYRAEHREMCLAKEHRRRALKRGNGGTHTAADISSQFTRQKGLCFYCHEKLLAYHVDHVMPLVRGGSNGPENLVIACPSCNMRKNARHPMDFAGVLF